jgi:hypothetical protein
MSFLWLAYVAAFVRPTGRVRWIDVAACLLVLVPVNFSLLLGVDGVSAEWRGLLFVNFLMFVDQMLILVLIRFWRSTSSVLPAVVAFLFWIQFGFFGLSLSAGRHGLTSSTSPEAVSILDRRQVGVFDTATLSSGDPTALQKWLTENGFLLPTSSGSVIESYVKDGWVFVASKLARDTAASDISTPHPLSFTFQCEKAVYPMRLTGVDNPRLRVELYVFGPGRARAPHFQIERCTQPNYPAVPGPDERLSWWRGQPATLNILHPLLRSWVLGAPVATHCSATLSPADMRQDVWLEWEPFSGKQHTLFSIGGARTVAFNWGSAILLLGLLIVMIPRVAKGFERPPLFKRIGVVITATVLSATVIFLCLPKIQVRLTRLPAYQTEQTLRELGDWLGDTHTVPPATGAEIERLLSNRTNEVAQSTFSEGSSRKAWENQLLGGLIREEDSPGNFILRESGNYVQFVVFDADGAEHVFADWYLPRHP